MIRKSVDPVFTIALLYRGFLNDDFSHNNQCISIIQCITKGEENEGRGATPPPPF